MTSLNYKEFGEGQPLIILHGLFGSLDNWVTLGKKFGETHHVYLVDQRNHGLSFHSEIFNYDAMAEDLNSFMTEHHIESAILLGHSMGGKTVMNFATKNPKRVDKLIVADIGPKFYPVHHTTIIKAFYSIDLNAIGNRKEADKQLASTIPEFGTRQFLLKNLQRTESGFKWKMNLDVIAKHIEEVGKASNQNASFDKPTLFIRGEKSDYILDEDLNLIHSIFTDSKVDTVSNAGHWLHAENPAEFFEKVTAFIES